MPPQTRAKSKREARDQWLAPHFKELDTTPSRRDLQPTQAKTDDQDARHVSEEKSAPSLRPSQTLPEDFDDRLGDKALQPHSPTSFDDQNNLVWSESDSLPCSAPTTGGETPKGIWDFENENGNDDVSLPMSSPKSGLDKLPDTIPIPPEEESQAMDQPQSAGTHKIDLSETASTIRRSSPFGVEEACSNIWDLGGQSPMSPLSGTFAAQNIDYAQTVSSMAPPALSRPPRDDICGIGVSKQPAHGTTDAVEEEIAAGHVVPWNIEELDLDRALNGTVPWMRLLDPDGEMDALSRAELAQKDGLAGSRLDLESEKDFVQSPPRPSSMQIPEPVNRGLPQAHHPYDTPLHNERTSPRKLAHPNSEARQDQGARKRKQRAKAPMQFDEDTQKVKEGHQAKKIATLHTSTGTALRDQIQPSSSPTEVLVKCTAPRTKQNQGRNRKIVKPKPASHASTINLQEHENSKHAVPERGRQSSPPPRASSHESPHAFLESPIKDGQQTVQNSGPTNGIKEVTRETSPSGLLPGPPGQRSAQGPQNTSEAFSSQGKKPQEQRRSVIAEPVILLSDSSVNSNSTGSAASPPNPSTVHPKQKASKRTKTVGNALGPVQFQENVVPLECESQGYGMEAHGSKKTISHEEHEFHKRAGVPVSERKSRRGNPSKDARDERVQEPSSPRRALVSRDPNKLLHSKPHKIKGSSEAEIARFPKENRRSAQPMPGPALSKYAAAQGQPQSGYKDSGLSLTPVKHDRRDGSANVQRSTPVAHYRPGVRGRRVERTLSVSEDGSPVRLQQLHTRDIQRVASQSGDFEALEAEFRIQGNAQSNRGVKRRLDFTKQQRPGANPSMDTSQSKASLDKKANENPSSRANDFVKAYRTEPPAFCLSEIRDKVQTQLTAGFQKKSATTCGQSGRSEEQIHRNGNTQGQQPSPLQPPVSSISNQLHEIVDVMARRLGSAEESVQKVVDVYKTGSSGCVDRIERRLHQEHVTLARQWETDRDRFSWYAEKSREKMQLGGSQGREAVAEVEQGWAERRYLYNRASDSLRSFQRRVLNGGAREATE